MSNVTSTANLSNFNMRKTNVGVDTSIFQASEVVCDTLVANNLDVIHPDGIIDLEGTVGINVVAVSAPYTPGVTTIAGAPGTVQTVYIGGNDADTGIPTYGANTGAKTINIGTSTTASTITVGGSGNNTISIGTGQADGSISIGTSLTALASSITIGNASQSASTLTLRAGGGNINMVGNVLKSTNPAFLLYLASTASNKTGNGTIYTLGTDALTEVYDRGGNATTAGVFTAPVTGIYDLRAQVTVSGATVATTFIITIVTTARSYSYTFNRAASSATQSVSISTLADMTATDTATVTILASGEAGDTDDIQGGGGLQPLPTYFCGTLVA